MPTLVRAEKDERDGLLAFLDAQRGGIRRSVLGLTDAQATARPSGSPSELTLAGLVKHVARTEEVWVQATLMGRPEFAGSEADYVSGFRLLEGETLASVLSRYADVARATEEAVNGLPDLEVTVALPEAPWFPPGMKVTARWILLHLIEEVARHAGHADIVREALDGRTAFELVADEHDQGPPDRP